MSEDQSLPRVREQSAVDARARAVMALRELQRRHVVEIETLWVEQMQDYARRFEKCDLGGRIMTMGVLVGQIHDEARELSLPPERRRGVDAEEVMTDDLSRLLVRQRCAQLILYTTLLMDHYRAPEQSDG